MKNYLAFGVAVIVFSGFSLSAHAQDACGGASAHIADCAQQYCGLAVNAEGCQAALMELSAEVGPGCDVAVAAQVSQATCHGLALRADTGPGSSGSGNICGEALFYHTACLEDFCATSEDNLEVCDVILEALWSVADMDLPCEGYMEREARLTLSRGCADVVADFGSDR